MPLWHQDTSLKQKITTRTTKALSLMRRHQRPGFFFMVHLPGGQSWVSIALKPSKLMAGFPPEVTGDLASWNVSTGDIAWDGKQIFMDVRSAVGPAKSKGTGLKGSEVKKSLKALKSSRLKLLKSATIGAIPQKDQELDREEEAPIQGEELDDETLQALGEVADNLTEEDINDLLSEVGQLEVQILFMEQLLELSEEDIDSDVLDDPGPVDFSPKRDVTPPTGPLIPEEVDTEQHVPDEPEPKPVVGEWVDGRYVQGEDIPLARELEQFVPKTAKRAPWRIRFRVPRYYNVEALKPLDKKRALQLVEAVEETVVGFATSAIELDDDILELTRELEGSEGNHDRRKTKDALNARIDELHNITTYQFQITFSVLKSYLNAVNKAHREAQKLAEAPKASSKVMARAMRLGEESVALKQLGRKLDLYQHRCRTALSSLKQD